MEMVAVPKSVLAYYQDTKVRGGVDVVLRRKRPQVPADLDWKDISSYYRALAAAQSVQFDYAVLLSEIWDAVWTVLPNANPLPLAECDPQRVWENSRIDRLFKIGSHTCEMMVYLDTATGVQIGIELRQGSKVLLRKSDFPADWEKGESNFWSPANEISVGKTIDTQKLKGFASQARKICLERLKG